MWTKTTSIILVVFLINCTSGQERWYKNNGIASVNCPLDDDPDDPTVLPFQGDCSKFIKCSYGLAYTLNCPRGLHWSKELNRCESQKVAACDPNATTPKPAVGGDGCTYKYKPHSTDCNKFFQCVDGKEFDLDCPQNLYWDKTINRCVLDDSVC